MPGQDSLQMPDSTLIFAANGAGVRLHRFLAP